MSPRISAALKIIKFLLMVAIPLLGSVPYILSLCVDGAYERVYSKVSQPLSVGPVAKEIKRSLQIFQSAPQSAQIAFHRNLYCWIMETPLLDELSGNNPTQRLNRIARFPNILGFGLPAKSAQNLLIPKHQPKPEHHTP